MVEVYHIIQLDTEKEWFVNKTNTKKRNSDEVWVLNTFTTGNPTKLLGTSTGRGLGVSQGVKEPPRSENVSAQMCSIFIVR